MKDKDKNYDMFFEWSIIDDNSDELEQKNKSEEEIPENLPQDKLKNIKNKNDRKPQKRMKI